MKIIKLSAVCVLVAMLLSLFATVSFAGDTTEINDIEGLAAISENPEGSYKLTSDISIPACEGLYFLKEFSGELDGNGHTISGFSVANDNITDNSSLCGFIAENSGKITNTVFSGFSIVAEFKSTSDYLQIYVGIVAAKNSGEISDCIVKNSTAAVDSFSSSPAPFSVVTNKIYVGGIAGLNTGMVSSCDVNAEISASCSASFASAVNEAYAGGVVGEDDDGSLDISVSITDCDFSGKVFSSVYAGGISAKTRYSELSNCRVNADISADVYAGGIVGSANNHCVVKSCVFDGTVVSDKICGGITAVASTSVIEMCAVYGSILCENDVLVAKLYAGGVCGQAFSSVIKNCFNASTISVSAPGVTSYIYVGGICGGLSNYSEADSYIRYCHNVGSIEATSTKINYSGAIIGTVSNSTVDDCFFLDASYDKGAGNGQANILEKSADDMKNISTFSTFDFDNVWFMGTAYPCLISCLQTSNTPAKPQAEKVGGTYVTLVAVDGCEYSIDRVIWYNNNTFSALSPDTEYSFYMRHARTDRFAASSESEPLTLKTTNSFKGDIDLNGKISLVDSMMAFYHVADRRPLSGEAFDRADMNGNGLVELDDAMLIFKIVSGKHQ